ncbi:MAG TPA: nuclear transport factor 2 family protein [Thermoleophilaceae bacterium]
MSQRNVETVRRGYDAFNRGDLDDVRTIYAPDVTAHAGALWPAAGDVSGVDGIIEAFASILATFENSEIVPEEFIELGDSVVVPTCWRGTLQSDSVIEQHLVAVYTMRDGLVVRIGYFGDMDEALEDLREREGRTS